MKIAFTTLGCPKWDLDTIIARAAEYGYDGVDFRGLGDQMNLWELPEFTSDAKITLAKFADAGLAVSGFSSGAYMFIADPSKRQAAIDEVTRYGELCETFGTRVIRVFGGLLKGTPLDDAYPIAVEMVEKMAAVAGPATVAVETHDDWKASAPLARVMSQVKAKNAGVLWDVNHPYQFEAETPRQTWDTFGKYVRYAHIKNSRKNEEGKCIGTLPEQGQVPLKEIIGVLRQGGYDGWLALEWEKRWHSQIEEPEVAFPAYAEFLRKQLA